MTENRLTHIEEQECSKRIIATLREERDQHERSLEMPPCRPYAVKRKKRYSVSPYWIVAASLAGFIAGFLTPNNIHRKEVTHIFTYMDTVASCGYSIAQMDIDTALLFTM